MLGVALGLTVSSQVGDRELGIGAASWSVITILLSLFFGGWVSSQCTVGEGKGEAALYGMMVWGIVFAMLLWLLAGGVRLGFSAMMGIAHAPVTTVAAGRLTDADLEASGFTREQITTYRQQFDQLQARGQNLGAEIRSVADDPRSREAAWWTFGGILLSLLASIAGGVAGAGPDVRIAGFRIRSTLMARPPRVESSSYANR
jgi:hypothetical protein